jgi:hypothetical protein
VSPGRHGDDAVLARARAFLAKAEAAATWADARGPLEEGLALLADALDAKPPARDVARNLGATYARTLYRRIEARLAAPQVSEPELEQMFALVRALDDRELPLPEHARDVKIDVVTRLVNLYCEGRSPAERQRVLEQLSGIVG